MSIEIPRAALDPLGQSPVLFDALIAEDEQACTFRKVLTARDPGVRSSARRHAGRITFLARPTSRSPDKRRLF